MFSSNTNIHIELWHMNIFVRMRRILLTSDTIDILCLVIQISARKQYRKSVNEYL